MSKVWCCGSWSAPRHATGAVATSTVEAAAASAAASAAEAGSIHGDGAGTAAIARCKPRTLLHRALLAVLVLLASSLAAGYAAATAHATAAETAAPVARNQAGSAALPPPAWRNITVARVLVGMRAVVEAERAAGSEPCVAATLVQLRTTCFRETSRRVAFLLPAAAPPQLAQRVDRVDNASGGGNSPQHLLAKHWRERAHGTREAWYGAMLAVRDAYVLQRPAREPPGQARQGSGILCGGRGVVVDVTTATVYDVSNGGPVPGHRDVYEAGDVLHVPIAVHNGIVAVVSQYHTSGFYHAVMETPMRLMYARGLALAGEVDVLMPALAFECKQRPYVSAAVANLGFDVPKHGDEEIKHPAGSAAVSATRSAARERKHARVLLRLHSVADLVLVPPERHVAVRRMMAALRAAMLETAPSGEQCDASARPEQPRPPFIVVLHRPAGQRDVTNLRELTALARAAHPLVRFVEVSDEQQRNMTAGDFACAFRDACGLVSGHGAGLSHMVYLSPRAHVMEIARPRQVWARHYEPMALALGLKYTHVAATTAGANAAVLDAERGLGHTHRAAWACASVTADAKELLGALAQLAAACQAGSRLP
jgi:hypothetical protein